MATIRLIDEHGEQVGIIDIQDALARAKAAKLDLVEVSPNVKPPVCRIMDFGREQFDQAKKRSAAKKKQKRVQIKEIKFRPATDVGDYKIKLRKITEFLSNGDRVKVTLRFRGREIVHRELGMDVLRRVQEDLKEFVTIEQQPKAEGRQMTMVLAPIKGASKIIEHKKQEGAESDGR
jgi:translation initiation factor IF-3